MSRLFFLIASIFFSSVSMLSHALDWKINSKNLSQSEIATFSRGIETAVNYLPPLLKSRIMAEIEFSISPKLDSKKEFDLKLLCPQLSDTSKHKKQVFAQVKKSFSLKRIFRSDQKNSYQIEVSPAVLAELKRGTSGARKFPCGHRNTYKKALSVLIHELAHVYDFENFRTKEEKEWKIKCRSRKNGRSKKALPTLCRYYDNLVNSVSSLYYFKTLAGRHHTGFLTHSRKITNQNWKSSIDPYEYKNLKESFAVNMEFFLMDPKFQCHSYAMNEFLRGHFSFRPFSEATCEFEYQSKKGVKFTLNPERVYQVHYLQVEAGENAESRWGHSMFRIILCNFF